MSNADIYLSTKADTVHILSIPQAVWAEKFGPHPRRFALYGASCVVGVRGKLFSNEGLETEIDYDTQASGAFTYVPQGPIRPAAPVILDDKKSAASGTSSRIGQSALRDAVLERDQGCIASGKKSSCLVEAAHIIPNSKKDKYIRSLELYRGDLSDHLESISDPRNALCFCLHCHRTFGQRITGLLPSPNWSDKYPGKEEPPTHVLWQQYEPCDGVEMLGIDNRMPCRLDLSAEHAPPVWLLEIAFGAFLMEQFGTKEGKEYMMAFQARATGAETSNSGGSVKRSSTSQKSDRDTSRKRASTASEKAPEKERGNHDEADRFDAFDAMLGMSIRQERMDSGYDPGAEQAEEEQMVIDAREQRQSVEIVQSWLKSQSADMTVDVDASLTSDL